jgi:hypothetical protein
METFMIYVSFLAAAWLLGQEAFLYGHAGFVRLAIPTLVTVIGLLMCNAYADPEKQSYLLKPILQTAGSISVAWLGQALMFDTTPRFAVPFGILAYGGCASLVFVSTLRILCSPIFSDQSKRPLPNQSLGSRKLARIPLKAPFQQFRQRSSEVPAPLRLKTAAKLGAVLLVATLLVPIVRREIFAPRWMAYFAFVLVLIFLMRRLE